MVCFMFVAKRQPVALVSSNLYMLKQSSTLSQESASISYTKASQPAPPNQPPSYTEETIQACRELQQDEILALEAIYEQKFSYARDEQTGHLLFTVSIEADLGSERQVIVTEEAYLPPSEQKQQKQPTSSEKNDSQWRTTPHHPGSREELTKGRGRGKGRGRARGKGRGNINVHAPVFQPLQDASNMQLDQPDGKNNDSFSMDKVSEALELPSTPPRLPEKEEHHLGLQYLLPIELVAILGQAYPIEEPPRIDLKCAWMTVDMRRAVLNRIQPLWMNDSSTFLMVDEITAYVSDVLAQEPPLRLIDRYAFDSSTSPLRTSLASRLKTHDRLTRHSTFSSESFACGICLETKKGARCTRLRNCQHVFCVECLYSFFELNIREGLVKNVSCADYECVKAKAKGKGEEEKGRVELDEIEAIVGKDLTDRYTWLVEKQKIESDPTVTYCPRETCNAPVPKEADEAYERLRICPRCAFSFCCYCRRTYHGTKSRCVFSQASSIVDKYVNGTDTEKAQLESRYGKNNVKRLVEVYLEEQANAKWIEENSTRCPDCQLDIERSFGCAHMTCSRCAAHFCFRCGSRLNARDPYGHYTTPGTSCFNKLFEYQPSEEQMNEALFQAMME